jgi:hypothetical protein
VWETNLEWWEEKSAELENLCEHVARVEDECAVNGEQLSWLVREISDALVDLNVLTIINLVLDRLWEEHASDADPLV